MGEYERMLLHFTATVIAPHLAAVLLAVALVALAAVAIRLVRFAGAVTAPSAVLLTVTAWATTASSRVVVVEKRARAPSSWEFLRA
jgi:hypothetical protein